MQSRNLLGRLAIIAATLLIMVQGAGAAETVRVIIAGRASSLQWPIFIGMAKGFFAARGVAIDVATAQSTAATMQQVVGGSGDIGVGGLTDPIRAIDKGAKLVLLRVETQIPPFSLWGKPTIKSIKDLRGKTVMVGGAKDITLIYFERMAAPNGLHPGDYDLVYAGTSPARLAALSSGAVDAAILYPPGTFRAAESGLTKLGDLGDYVKDMPFTGYAASATWAASNRAAVLGFLQGCRDAVKWFYDSANRSAAVDILLKQSHDMPGDVEKTYDYYRAIHIFPVDGTINAAAIASLVKALSAGGDLASNADPQRFVDPGITKIADEASKR
jgi:NitT/TauT family transport system substrate-binding protein